VRLFTVEEANALLPKVEGMLIELQRQAAVLAEKQQELAEAQVHASSNGHSVAEKLAAAQRELDQLVACGHDPQRMTDMLKALGLDAKAVARAEPALLRDMQRICGVCQAAEECASELAAGTAVHNYRDFCINTPTLDALSAAAKAQA